MSTRHRYFYFGEWMMAKQIADKIGRSYSATVVWCNQHLPRERILGKRFQ